MKIELKSNNGINFTCEGVINVLLLPFQGFIALIQINFWLHITKTGTSPSHRCCLYNRSLQQHRVLQIIGQGHWTPFSCNLVTKCNQRGIHLGQHTMHLKIYIFISNAKEKSFSQKITCIFCAQYWIELDHIMNKISASCSSLIQSFQCYSIFRTKHATKFNRQLNIQHLEAHELY